MALRIVAALVLGMGAAACGLTATLIVMRRVDQVNKRLPEAQRFAAIGWYPGKYGRFRAEYDRLFPGAFPRRQLLYLQLGGAAFVIALALVLRDIF
jgi:hypothetical protein